MATDPRKELDIIEFATRVERLCEFLINKYVTEGSRDGSADLVALEKLKEDAVDIVAGTARFPIRGTIHGLAEALSPLPTRDT
jgi:hypothetical protein